MAKKYRCPVCGATHKDQIDHCRLCGQKLGPDAVVGERQAVRYVEEKRAGLGGIMLVVILLVIVLIAGFVIFGVIPSNRAVENVAKNVPGLQPQNLDGWSTLDYPEGGFTAEFPGGERQLQKNEGVYTADLVLGKETHIQITAERLLPPDEYANETKTTDQADPLLEVKRYLNGQVDAYINDISAEGAKVDKRDNVYVLGVPAVVLEIHNFPDPNSQLRTDATLNAKVMLAIANGVLYKVTVTSVYKDIPQFDRVVNSLVVTAPPGERTGVTATSSPA